MRPEYVGLAAVLCGAALPVIPEIGSVLALAVFILVAAFWMSSLVPTGRATFQCKACEEWFTARKEPAPVLQQYGAIVL